MYHNILPSFVSSIVNTMILIRTLKAKQIRNILEENENTTTKQKTSERETDEMKLLLKGEGRILCT